jgi:hypothetical protein
MVDDDDRDTLGMSKLMKPGDSRMSRFSACETNLAA